MAAARQILELLRSHAETMNVFEPPRFNSLRTIADYVSARQVLASLLTISKLM